VADGNEKEGRPYQLITTYKSGNWVWALGMDSNDGDSTARLGERNNENTYGARGSYKGRTLEPDGPVPASGRRQERGLTADHLQHRPQPLSVAWERERDDTQADTETRTAYTAQILHDVNESMAVYVEGYQLESDGMTPMRRDLIIGSRYRF